MDVPPPQQPERPETKDIYNFGDTVRLINLENTKFADMNHKIGTVFTGMKEECDNPTTEARGMWSKEENGRHKVQVMVEKGGVYDAETATYSQPIFKTVKVLPKCMELVNGGLVTNVVRSVSVDESGSSKGITAANITSRVTSCKSEMFPGGPTSLVFFDAMKAMNVEGARAWLNQMTTYCASHNEHFNLPCGKFGDGPLQACLEHCTKRSGEMARILLQHGDDPNQRLNPGTPMGIEMDVPMFVIACMRCNGECFAVMDALVEGGADVNGKSSKFGNALFATLQPCMVGNTKKRQVALAIFRYLLQKSSYHNSLDVNQITSMRSHPSMPPVEQHVLQSICTICMLSKKEKYMNITLELLILAMHAGARPGQQYQQYDDWTKQLEPVCALCIPLSHICDAGTSDTKRKSLLCVLRTIMQHASPEVRLENMNTKYEPLALEYKHPLSPIDYALHKTIENVEAGEGGEDARESLEILLSAGLVMSKKSFKLCERKLKGVAKRYKACVQAGKKCVMCEMYVFGRNQKLSSCSGCCHEKNPKRYCSKKCQVRHWKMIHKKECARGVDTKGSK